jgi:hypothetical protein
MHGRGAFTGRCYLCGEPCGHTYCHEHRWAAKHLAMPYRRDTKPAPSMEEVTALIDQLREADRTIAAQERKLDAWRNHPRLTLVKTAA